jgi:alpha-ketoglutarate-dependent taurine dioxygenase
MAELATVARTESPLKVRKLGAFLGAEVTGIDLTKPLDDATVRAVDAALAANCGF